MLQAGRLTVLRTQRNEKRMQSQAKRHFKVAFLNLNDGAHGEYGALLAAAVAKQPDAKVLVIAPERLLEGARARAHLEGIATHAIRFDGKINKVKSLIEAWRILREFRPDVIHDPVGSGIGAMLPLRPFLPRLAPLVVTEHNPVVHPGLSGRHHGVARALTRRMAALIHVHGPQAYAEMRDFGVPDERLAIIRHGAFDEYGAAARRFERGGSKQILIFGGLRPNKGIDMLPEIFTKVRAFHPDATLLVTGERLKRIDSARAEAMDKALDKLATMDGCTLSNAHVPEEDIARLFGSCGLCLLPYHTATQSGVAMIAMTTGAPLVVTNVGDLPDVVEHGRTGLLAAPNANAIADQIIRAFNDPDGTRARASAALSFAAEECAWPVIGRQIVTAYRPLVSNGSGKNK